MRTTQLKAFDAVARFGGFSKAAERLNLTQPAVTIQVRALEETYGVKLFKRRGGRVHLTDAGRGLAERTQTLFAAEDQIRTYLEKTEHLEIGDIRVSVDSPHFAMDLIARFRGAYPGVQLAVALGNTPTVWGHLLDGSADIAVVANPPKDSRVKTMALGERGLRALLPVDHSLASNNSVSLDALEPFPCIFREPQSNTQKSLMRALKKNRSQWEGTMELGSREAVVEAVSSGLGVGFIFDGEAPADTRVTDIAIDGLERENRDTIAILKSQRHRNNVQAFLEQARLWMDTKTGL